MTSRNYKIVNQLARDLGFDPADVKEINIKNGNITITMFGLDEDGKRDAGTSIIQELRVHND